MLDTDWTLPANIAGFIVAAIVIAAVGSRLAGLADRIADRTGLGEALTGTFFLGVFTSLPGLAAAVMVALMGRPAMAIATAIGGIAVQTTFLAVADIFHRKANLEHAAASVTNMVQAAGLVLLLAILLLGISGPDVTLGHVHPVTLLLFIGAAGTVWLAFATRDKPMWSPRRTRHTVEDKPARGSQRENLPLLLADFTVTALVVIAAGILAAVTTEGMVDQTGMSETVAGGLFLAVTTSLPELITTISAVRRGALTLAVSDIVGGNFFDVMFVCFADLVFLGGSLYHGEGVGQREIFLVAFAILLNILLLLGLLFRQRRGFGNIGFESLLIVLLYVGGFIVVSGM